ncbi:MAG: sigma-54-dependent Fis family transcriptional regulator, partial [Planctomycetaceae bacterium]
ADDVAVAIRIAREISPDLIVLCEDVNHADAMQLVKFAHEALPRTAVVVLSEKPSVDHAVKLVRAGALDYISGPTLADDLKRLLTGLAGEQQAARDGDGRFFSNECPPGVPFVGRSPSVVKTLETIRMVAQSRCNPILILGETGTGKELAARAVHTWRCRDMERFVAVNCATLSASLLESELFGHVKGAFTGADRDKTGLFELAENGSIFLDEISEIPPDLQAKLLRVLQEKSFRKVGGTKDIRCNCTIIASSNRNLLEEAEKGKFRRDLYYRLAIFPIRVPSLADADRADDIPLLAEYFVKTYAETSGGGPTSIAPAAQARLNRYNWPGNVRELRNVIERAVIVERSEQITPASLIFDSSDPKPADQPTSPKDFSLEAAQKEFILRALKETGWQKTKAAILLGITRGTLHAKLKRYDIQIPGDAENQDDDLLEDLAGAEANNG